MKSFNTETQRGRDAERAGLGTPTPSSAQQKMPKIKFSRYYPKLMNMQSEEPLFIENAMLLAVLDVRLEDLPEPLLQYDTHFVDASFDDDYFPLPCKGDYLLLLFTKFGMRDIFTTLRRSTPRKREYYRGLIGKEFEVVIKEEEDDAF